MHKMMAALGELWHTLVDVRECGDLRGHLGAWWAVITGQVDPDAPLELMAGKHDSICPYS